jgi:hypothetical protein
VLYPKGRPLPRRVIWRERMRNLLDKRPASMRSVQADSAASRGINEWDEIAWPIVYLRVRRLQTRIAKATREQDWRRVKALQRFLVNSFSAKVLPVKRVSENDGKRTPGVDGEIWSTPEAKWQAIQRLGSRGLRRSHCAGCTSPSAAAEYSGEDDRPFRANVTGDSAGSALLWFSTRLGHDQSMFCRF